MSLYSTRLQRDDDLRVVDDVGDMAGFGKPVSHFRDVLYLGELGGYFESAGRQCPRGLGFRVSKPEDLRVFSERVDDSESRVDKRYTISAWRSWLIGIPYTGYVVALSAEAHGDLDAAIQLLNDTYFRRSLVRQGDDPLLSAVVSHARRDAATGHAVPDLAMNLDAHQILVLPDLELIGGHDDVDDERLRRVLFRGEPAREAFSNICRPASPNRPPGSVVALRSSVSVVAGLDEHLVNGLRLASAQSVASIARSRRIRRHAYEALEVARSLDSGGPRAIERPELEARRAVLSQLSNFLLALETELSFGIRANSDVALILPVAEITEYHRDLAAVLGNDTALEVTDHLLQSLARAIASTRDTIAAAERERDERLQDRVTMAGATLLVPGLVAAFYGANIRGFPGYNHASGVAWLLAFMFASGAAMLLLIRWTRRRHPRPRPQPVREQTARGLARLPPLSESQRI